MEQYENLWCFLLKSDDYAEFTKNNGCDIMGKIKYFVKV